VVQHLEKESDIKALFEIFKRVGECKVKQKRQELTTEAIALQNEILCKRLGITPEKEENLIKRKKVPENRKQLSEKLEKCTPLQGNYFSKKLRELISTIDEQRKICGFEALSFKYDWLIPPTDNIIEQLFYKTQNIPFYLTEDKKKHRLRRVNNLLKIIDSLRENAGITTDALFEQKKESFINMARGKAHYINVASTKLSKKRPEDILVLSDLSPSETQILGQIVYLHNLIVSNQSQDAVLYISQNIELNAKLHEICKQNTVDVMALKLHFRKNKAAYFIKILSENSIYFEKLIEEELLSIVNNCYESYNVKIQNINEQIYQIVDNVKSIKDQTELENAERELEKFQEEFLKEYKRFSSDPFMSREIIPRTDDELRSRVLSQKRQALDMSRLREKLSTSPLEDHLHLIPGLKKQFGEGNSVSIMANMFLVATFYEQLKEIIDYPELSNFKDIFMPLTPNVKSRKTHHSDPSCSLAQEVICICINIRFILEQLKHNLSTN
jgi:hypothetical protein